MNDYTIRTGKGSDDIRNYGEMSELEIIVGGRKHKAFLQNGFFEHIFSSSPLHNHRYSEIHIVKNGSMDMYIEGKPVHVSKGCGILVPAGLYHMRKCTGSGESIGCAFQTDIPLESIAVEELCGAADLLFDEIAIYNRTGECPRLSALLSLVCSVFSKDSFVRPKPMCDREFIICEFFANNYDKDITLSDIALQLSLSKKQAERLIIKTTGMSFRRLVVAKRMENAAMLVKTEGVSLARAAELVGYRSYSGFWKALKSYEKEQKKK